MPRERCSFNEIIDLPAGTNNGTFTQCPVCGAYRDLKLAYEDGDVYHFPSHCKIARQRNNWPCWKRIDNVWRWSAVSYVVTIEHI